MKDELDKQLCEKYPKIFKNRGASMMESCMHWGIECGDGWYDVIDLMCEAMSSTYSTSVEVDAERAIALGLEPSTCGGGTKYYLAVNTPQVIADQVKEKFGGLRFYFHLEFEYPFRDLAYGPNALPRAKKIADGYSSHMDGIVHMAETMADRTCEVTGKRGELHVGGGWYRTLNREYAQSESGRKWIACADIKKPDESQ